jgi:hypothetical protein
MLSTTLCLFFFVFFPPFEIKNADGIHLRFLFQDIKGQLTLLTMSVLKLDFVGATYGGYASYLGVCAAAS